MYSLAAIALVGAGIAQVAALILGQYHSDLIPFGVAGVISLVFAVLLYGKRRWAAWLSFLCLLVGVAFALSALNTGAAPDLLVYAIAAFNVLGLLALFVVLWRHGTAK